ncbi:MAG: FtsX-like permease family protein [Planctomycetota bacterium]
MAWKNLTNNPRRLMLAVAGVGFAAILMFTQNGFRNALLDSPIVLVQRMQCDLVAISPARYMLPDDQQFNRQHLRRAKADPDVLAAEPLLIERWTARVRVSGNPARPIRVLSVPESEFVRRSQQSVPTRQLESAPKTRVPRSKRVPWMSLDGLDADALRALTRPHAGLVDRKTRQEYGFALDEPGELTSQWVELSGKRIELVGTVTLGTDFANEGTLIIRESAFADYFPYRGNRQPLEVVDLGMIRLRPGADHEEVAARLTRLAPEQWEVLTRDALKKREQSFWQSQTPVGKIFFIGTVMGFAVGIIICYQILFTSLQDAMPEFATLKAMGYPNRFFVTLVVRQSTYLSLLGFVPAVAVTLVLFRVLEGYSGLPMLLTVERALTVLGLTTLMCLISGLLALRKLLNADPASLF